MNSLPSPLAAAPPPPSSDPAPERPRPAWSTASFGHAPDTLPADLDTLGEHLGRCRGQGGRWFVLRCRAEAMQVFVASHIVTTLVVVALLIGAALLVM